jgi:tRNA (cmo5U34)-methyltransferase
MNGVKIMSKNYDFTFAQREEGFDDHIEHSIRGYKNLLDDIVSLSRNFVEDETNVVDIGCSTGKLTEAFVHSNQNFCKYANYIGIELAPSFFEELDKRHDRMTNEYYWANVDFQKKDVRQFKFENCSLVTSIFTLQFMPRKDRFDVIKNIYDGLNFGGAFIFAEKTVCEDSRLQEMITFNFYDYKRKHFEASDILEKEKTLRNMLKPNTWKELEGMLECAGFKTAQPFWRNHMFVGAIAIK